MRYYCILILFFIITSQLFSQNSYIKHDSFYLNYGLFGSYNLNFHTADFVAIGTNPSSYESGSGSGFTAGALIDIFPYKYFGVNIKGMYSDISGELRRTGKDSLSLRGKLLQGDFEYVLNSTLAIVSMEENIQANIFEKLRISVGIGEGYLITNSINQYEKILDASRGYTFIDKDSNDTRRDIRDEYTGDINNPNKF